MYAERPSCLPHVVAWRRTPRAGGPPVRILPDGCVDLIWHDGALFVAGPDTTARLSAAAGAGSFAALRFAAGTGPGVLGVPAVELRDRHVPLADLWHPGEALLLAEQVRDGDGCAVLERAVAAR